MTLEEKKYEEDQILILQNKLIQKEIDDLKIKDKIRELNQKAEFYEDLHNQEKRDLYETELKNAMLEKKIKDLENEYLKPQNKFLENNKSIKELIESKDSSEYEEKIKLLTNYIGKREIVDILKKKLKKKVFGR